MLFQKNLRRLGRATPKPGLRAWGRTLLAVVALVIPTLTVIPATAGVPSVTLTVVGGGAVSASTGGSPCTSASTCTYSVFPVSFAALAVAPSGSNPGWEFAGWDGACSGTGACSLSSGTDPSTAVIANFEKIWKLSITVVGSGTVSGPGVTCVTGGAGTCEQTYRDGASLSLSQASAPGYTFNTSTGWTVAANPSPISAITCSEPSCSLPGMTRNVAVTATFACATSSVGDQIANGMPYRGTGAVAFADLDPSAGTEDLVRGCFAAIPATGTPNGLRSTTLGAFPTDSYDTSGGFGILTTGSFEAADDPNGNGGVGGVGTSLSGPNVRGNSDFDVSILRLDFTATTDACLTFDFQFFSEEAGELGLTYNDAFVAELDSSSWYTYQASESEPAEVNAFDGIVYSPLGDEISVRALLSKSGLLTAGAATGTTYDGATAVLQAQRTFVSAGPHALFLSIFDVGDRGLDSAVFVDRLILESLTDCAEPTGATPVKYPLNVTIAPVGAGTVLADENGSTGFTCPTTTCGRYYDSSDMTEVELTATANTGYRFDKWRGSGCEGKPSTTCTVTMDEVQSVTARFVRQFGLTVSSAGSGVGSITSVSPGGDATDGEARLYDYDPENHILRTVTVTASPGSDNAVAWTGCSYVSGNVCTALMNHDRDVVATFYSTSQETLRTTVTVVPGGTSGQIGSGDRITYGVTVENRGNQTSSSGALHVVIDAESGSAPDVMLVSGCTPTSGSSAGGNGVYDCALSSLAKNASQTLSITVDAPTVGDDQLLTATFTPNATACGASKVCKPASVGTLLRASAPQDYKQGSTTFSTYASAPVSERNQTGTDVVSVGGETVTVGEASESASGATVLSMTSTSKTSTTGTTSTSQPLCDPTLPMTCWRFDIDARPLLLAGKPSCQMPSASATNPCYSFTFVFDRTTITDPVTGMLLLSLRKVVMYHRADGKTSYVKLAACPSTGSIGAPCVKSIALQASTGDLGILVYTPFNGQWKGGR